MKWRPIVGYEDAYEISEHGVIRRLVTVRNRKAGHVMRPVKNHKGYWCVALSANSIRKSYMIHALVAATFIGPRPEGLQVDHVDCDKTNNHYSNLEYVTCAENIRRAQRAGLRPKNYGNAKLTHSDVREIRAAYATGVLSQKVIGDRYGLTQANVSCIVLGRTWGNVT